MPIWRWNKTSEISDEAVDILVGAGAAIIQGICDGAEIIRCAKLVENSGEEQTNCSAVEEIHVQVTGDAIVEVMQMMRLPSPMSIVDWDVDR